MKNLLSPIKDFVIWLLPVIGLHFYLQHFYGLSIWHLGTWWYSHFASVADAYARVFGFAIIFLLFLFPVTSLLNTLYLDLFGKRQSLVFLGYSAKSTPMYYRARDSKKAVFTGYDHEKEFNYSFNDVYRLHRFIKMPFAKYTSGVKNKYLHPYSILSRIMYSIFFFFPLMVAVNALVLPAYQPSASAGVIHSNATMVSIDQMLSSFQLNRVTAMAIFLFSLLLAMYFSNRQKQDTAGKLLKPLPENIAAGNTVLGKPLKILETYAKKIDPQTEQNISFDTGLRRVTFKFDYDFTPAVYVTMRFDTRRFPELEAKIKQAINSGRSVELTITPKLRLQALAEQDDADDTDFKIPTS
jgi:hypothetical protein